MKTLKFMAVPFLLMVFCVAADSYQDFRTGTFTSVEGNVTVRTSDGRTFPAEVGTQIGQGDVVSTRSGSSASVVIDGLETTTTDIAQNSRVVFSELIMSPEAGTQSTLLDLTVGKILIKAEKVRSDSSRFEVKTPTSVVGVRGTTFAVEVEALD